MESESLDRSIEEVGSPEHVFYLTLFTLIIHQQQSYCATVGLAGSVRDVCNMFTVSVDRKPKEADGT